MQVWETGDNMTGVGTAEYCNTSALLHSDIFSKTGVETAEKCIFYMKLV
jgi:hypothetical protein